MNPSRRGFFPSLSVTVRAGSLMDPWHHFWMMFAFHFYFFISLFLSLSSSFFFCRLFWAMRWVQRKTSLKLAMEMCSFGGHSSADEMTILHEACCQCCESDESVNWYTCCYSSHKHVRTALKNISLKEYFIKHCGLLLHANKIMCSEVIYYVK